MVKFVVRNRCLRKLSCKSRGRETIAGAAPVRWQTASLRAVLPGSPAKSFSREMGSVTAICRRNDHCEVVPYVSTENQTSVGYSAFLHRPYSSGNSHGDSRHDRKA